MKTEEPAKLARRWRICLRLCYMGLFGVAIVLGYVLLGSPERLGATQSQPRPLSDPPDPASAIAEQYRPCVLVEEEEHDFGFVDPWEDCTHAFVIRNVGDAPSTLRVDTTTCVCTVGGLSGGVVYPGGRVKAVLTVKPKVKEHVFRQGATIHTEDPDHAAINLWARGVVRKTVDVTPAQLEFSNLRQGQPQTAEVLITSPVWESFRVGQATSSLPGMICKIEPAEVADLTRLGARSGYRLSVTVPDDLPPGRFADRVSLSVQPENDAYKARELVVDVTGEVAAPVSFDGPRLNAKGVLELGTVYRGQGVRTRLTLKIRDARREIHVKGIHTTPEYLRVQVTPYAEVAQQLGLYRIDIEVPPDAPPASFKGRNHAEIQIDTDHPKLPSLKLQVEFAVAANTAGDLR